ncbi:hypothetical protein V6N13_060451 [Hibiscus sabdariffa]
MQIPLTLPCSYPSTKVLGFYKCFVFVLGFLDSIVLIWIGSQGSSRREREMEERRKNQLILGLNSIS